VPQTCAGSCQLDAERTSFKAGGPADSPLLTVFSAVREKMIADRPLRSDARILRVHSSQLRSRWLAKRLVLSPCKAAVGNAFLLGSCCSVCFSAPAWLVPLPARFIFSCRWSVAIVHKVAYVLPLGCQISARRPIVGFHRINGSPSFFAVWQRPLDDIPSARPQALPQLIRKSFCRSKTAEYFLIEARLGSELDLLDRVAP
jgi:hypothetical protein